MAFPWKKVKKSTRISELLSNQIHHRRKGGGSPLVVETGFPTSLIDLFVKNKERLERQSKKNNKPCSSPSPPPPAAAPPPPSSSPPPPSDGDDVNDSLISVAPSRPLPSLLTSRHVRDAGGVMTDGEGEECVAANGVVVAILRMFLVVVSVLGTKKFVVGITISAFLLVFLECVGKHVGRLSRRRLIMRCRKDIVQEKADNEIREENLSLSSRSGSMNPDQDRAMSGLNREIECSVVRRIEEIECEEEVICDEIDINSGKGKGDLDLGSNEVVVLEERNSCEIGELSRRKSSRRAKIKLKIKELVPKKLRNARKKTRGVEHQEASYFAAMSKEEKDLKGDAREFKFHSVSSSIPREIDDGKDIVGSDELVEARMVDAISLKGEETKSEQNFGYVILLLIVLFGLVGGRILAMMLTLTWCLMQKSRETIRRYVKLPFLQCSV